MPRAADIASTRASRKDHIIGKTPPFPPLRCQCTEVGCPWSYERVSDLKRHEKRHMSPAQKERLMFRCPVPGCAHKTLQKSNMATHYRTHTGEKSCICLESAADGAPCVFRCGDPGSLTRHKTKVHGAGGKGKSARYTPYKRCRTFSSTTSTSDSGTAPSSPSSPASDYSDESSSDYLYQLASSSSASPFPSSSSQSSSCDASAPWETTQDADLEATFEGILNGSICVPVAVPSHITTTRPGLATLYPAAAVPYFGFTIPRPQPDFTLSHLVDFSDPYVAQQFIFEYDAPQKSDVLFGYESSYGAPSFTSSSCEYTPSSLDFPAPQYSPCGLEFDAGLGPESSVEFLSDYHTPLAGFEHEWFACNFVEY